MQVPAQKTKPYKPKCRQNYRKIQNRVNFFFCRVLRLYLRLGWPATEWETGQEQKWLRNGRRNGRRPRGRERRNRKNEKRRNKRENKNEPKRDNSLQPYPHQPYQELTKLDWRDHFCGSLCLSSEPEKLPAQYCRAEITNENLATVLVIISGISLVFSREICYAVADQ